MLSGSERHFSPLFFATEAAPVIFQVNASNLRRLSGYSGATRRRAAPTMVRSHRTIISSAPYIGVVLNVTGFTGTLICQYS
jgi:hypothetical protein